VRGTPEETRRRLVAAAGVAFERDGYAGTDTNRIAREAGYSPGTFYKHFGDKRDAFLAVYVEWIMDEWAQIGRIVAEGRPVRDTARALVDTIVGLHTRWRGFRKSLLALVGEDATVRRAFFGERAKQLDAIAILGGGDVHRADDALLLFVVERTADAIADGEPAALGVEAEALIERLVDRVEARLRAPRRQQA
jgi:AcrR family transcriptional regulator